MTQIDVLKMLEKRQKAKQAAFEKEHIERWWRMPGVPAPRPQMVKATVRRKLTKDELMDQLLEKEIERQRRWYKTRPFREGMLESLRKTLRPYKGPQLMAVKPTEVKAMPYPKISGELPFGIDYSKELDNADR